MNARKILPVAFILLIPAYILLQDRVCAKYGLGIFDHYSEILHGANITYLNGPMITHNRSRDYSAILWPGAIVVADNGDTVRVEKVTKYAVENGALYVYVQATPPAVLVFRDREAVLWERPSLVQDLPELSWLDLQHKPAVVSYWRLITFLLSIIEGVLILWVLIGFIRSHAP